ATGLAFAPLFAEAGVAGAPSVALANALAGIVCGSVIGAPLAALLIERCRLRTPDAPGAPRASAPPPGAAAGDAGAQAAAGLRSFVLVLLAMGLGTWIGEGIGALGVTLPGYIGAMLVGALIRNLDDRRGWFGLSARSIDVVGNVSLSLFLVVALMDLHLWDLA